MDSQSSETQKDPFPFNDNQKKSSGGGMRAFIRSVLSFVKFIVIVLVIVIPIRMYVAQPFIVRGASMEPTFENGDYLIIDEFTYRFSHDARPGDVVVFRYPEDPSTFFIKRIIGIPGDTVEIKEGNVSIERDGESFSDSFKNYTGQTFPDGRWELGEDQYFVLGDNRLQSSDSRFWGTLPENLIIGRAFVRLWPLSEIEYMPGR